MQNEEIVLSTKQWVQDVVIGLNFCPFAKKVFDNNSIRYVVVNDLLQSECLLAVHNECMQLDVDEVIATTLLIFPNSYPEFLNFLKFLTRSEDQLSEEGYDGIYQLASFHPDYLFAGSVESDAANYTNRSIYPMIHLLRESSIDEVVAINSDADRIPEQNITLARAKGLHFMQQLRNSCKQKN